MTEDYIGRTVKVEGGVVHLLDLAANKVFQGWCSSELGPSELLLLKLAALYTTCAKSRIIHYLCQKKQGSVRKSGQSKVWQKSRKLVGES